jgi:hypothetical protein
VFFDLNLITTKCQNALAHVRLCSQTEVAAPPQRGELVCEEEEEDLEDSKKTSAVLIKHSITSFATKKKEHLRDVEKKEDCNHYDHGSRSPRIECLIHLFSSRN